MLWNYLTTALRTLRRQWGFAAVNVFGLGLGMAVCLLVGLFVWQERTYDRFHEHAERLYRTWIVEEFGEEAGQRRFVNTQTPLVLGPAIEASFPEIEAVVRVRATSTVVGPEGHRFEEPLHAVDPRFFEVFSFPLLAGDPATALGGPGRVVLTTEAAERYFPDQDPIGQTLPLDADGQTFEYLVTGVAAPPPVASSLQLRLLIPLGDWEALVGEGTRTSWHSVSVETFVLMRSAGAAAALEAGLPGFVDRIVRQDGWEEHNVSYAIHLQPLPDLRLGETLPAEVAPVSYRQYLSLLVLIAAFVLMVAAINFVTLSLGQSARRAREVGLRKTLGAQRGQVAAQFWGEALVLAALGLGFGLALAALAAPWFSDLAGIELAFGLGPRTLGLVVALLAVVALGAGAYPALVLSGFKPVEALKDRLQLKGDRSLLHRGLIVTQFGLAILLVIGTLFVGRQLDFMRSAPLGFERDHVVVIPAGMATRPMLAVLDRYRQEQRSSPRIEAVSAAAFALSEPWASAGLSDETGAWRTFRLNWGEADFLPVSGVPLAAGRLLDGERAADSMRVIVNEAFVRAYGWGSPEAALGRSLPGTELAAFEIAGVVRDFHYDPLRDAVEPLVYTIHPNALLRGVSDVSVPTTSLRKLTVRIAADDVPATLAALRSVWEAAAPDLPFQYYFLDEAVQARYRQEERLARIASAASGLAVLIAALGLFALATLAVMRRRKEVGVRKVLGASTVGLVVLLSRDFLALVAVAFVVVAPVGYVAVSRWLGAFAYRIEPGVGVFLAAGLLAAVVAFVAVSYHALRAATADPVEALRAE